MAYGTWPFNMIQMRRGTAVTAGAIAAGDSSLAATTVWRGTFSGWDDTRERQETVEDVGTMAKGKRTADTRLAATVPFAETTLTFEQVLHWLEASMGQVTPTGSGPYVYEHSVPLSSTPPTIRPYTLRVGNVQVATDVQIIPGCWVEEMTFSGEAGGFWTIAGTWQGQRAINGAFTNAIALPDVEDAIFSNTSLYIDASGGTIGTTQVQGVLVGAEIKYMSKIEWVPPGDGVLYGTRIKVGRPEVTFTLKLEVEEFSGVSVVAAQRTAYRNNTLQLFRLACAGSGGRSLEWDFAGRYTNFGAYEKLNDTNTVVTVEGYADYSATDALMFGVTATNGLSVVP